MNRYQWLVLGTFLSVGGWAVAAEDVRIVVEAVPSAETSEHTSPFSTNLLSAFPADVDFKLEPLYPARNNQAKAKIALVYSCVADPGGGRVVPCHITIDEPVARENSGGHVAHLDGRPTGRHVPSAGWVSTSDGLLRSTYHASEIGGVVDATIHCDVSFGVCRGGKVAFGVGVQSLEDLGQGVGYVLTGDKPQHPSNHWGVPSFLAAVRKVAAQFAETYPDNMLRYNDVSLEYGGVFDVVTRTGIGYDWTPPHQSHRLGTNMDIGIPRGYEQGELAAELFESEGVRVLREDQFHWHLSNN